MTERSEMKAEWTVDKAAKTIAVKCCNAPNAETREIIFNEARKAIYAGIAIERENCAQDIDRLAMLSAQDECFSIAQALHDAAKYLRQRKP